MKTPSRVLRAFALLLAALASGCAGDAAEKFFVRPGNFDYLACPAIADAQKDAAKREEKLKLLIDRASKSSVGVMMAEASYRGDYLKAQGDQKELAEVAQRKNCAAATPPAVASPAPPTRR